MRILIKLANFLWLLLGLFCLSKKRRYKDDDN